MTDTAETPRRGRPPGVKLKSRGMLRLDDETYARLQRFQAETGEPLSTMIRKAITAYLDEASAE